MSRGLEECIRSYDPDVIYAGIGSPRLGIGKQGAVYKSTDGGNNWVRANASGSLASDALITSLVFNPSNRTLAPGTSTPGTLYLSSQYGFFESKDGGATWTASNTGLPHTNVARVALSRSRPEGMYLTLYTPSAAPWRGEVRPFERLDDMPGAGVERKYGRREEAPPAVVGPFQPGGVDGERATGPRSCAERSLLAASSGAQVERDLFPA